MELADSTPDASSRGREAPVRIPAWTPPRFFDAASGLPPSPACLRWLDAGWQRGWADPAGRHMSASHSRAVLAQSRSQVADYLGCAPAEVWFAPNADAALAGAATAITLGGAADRVVTSPVERLSVLHALDALADRAQVEVLPVTGGGRTDPAAVAERAGARRAGLVILQAANREIGTVQPVAEVAVLLDHGPPLLVDATAVRTRGEVPDDWDCIVLEPSIWGGPTGIAIMACRAQIPWATTGQTSPSDRFPGRVGIPLAAAAAMTLPDSAPLRAEEERLSQLADGFARTVIQALPDSARLGDPEHRLGYLVSLSVLYANAEQLVDGLSRLGFGVQSGSACTSDTRRPSHVLASVGAPTHGNLRVSLPPGCDEGELAELAAALIGLVRQQRTEAGLA